MTARITGNYITRDTIVAVAETPHIQSAFDAAGRDIAPYEVRVSDYHTVDPDVPSWRAVVVRGRLVRKDGEVSQRMSSSTNFTSTAQSPSPLDTMPGWLTDLVARLDRTQITVPPFLDEDTVVQVYSPRQRFGPLQPDHPSVGKPCGVCGYALRVGERPALTRFPGWPTPGDDGLNLQVFEVHERCVYGHRGAEDHTP